MPLSHRVALTLMDVTDEEQESLRPTAPLGTQGQVRDGFCRCGFPAEHRGKCCT